MNAVPLSQLPSRVSLHHARTSLRDDPYWSRGWRTGSTGEWFSVREFREQENLGRVKTPAWLRMTEEDARARVSGSRGWEQVLRVVAALDQWRTMTVQQVEALTDVAGIASGDRSLVSALWNAGLIDICVLGSAFATVGVDRGGMLLRPARASAAVRAFEGRMSYVEWVSVTSGLGLDANRQFSRHNILASEFGLRVAEFGHAAMVLGEKVSGMGLLAYSGVGDAVPTSGANNGSDLTVVRADGLRIAVEVTASKVGGWFDAKAEKLALVLHRRRLADTGLCVLFVTAPHQDASAAESADVVRKVKRSIQKAVRLYPGTALDPTAQRIGVISWADLFPALHQATPDFGKLPVDRPTGPGFIGDPNDETVWERGFFLDTASTPFAPTDPQAMTAVLGNAAGLRGAPHMLRQTSGRPVLSDISVQRMGLSGVPQVAGTKPLTEARGGSARRTLPPRLTF